MPILFEMSLPEWQRFKDLQDRSQWVKERLATIGRTIPDATEAQRTKLLAERVALQAEAQSLPTDLGEAARLYCLAHLAWLESRYHELDGQWSECDRRLLALAADIKAANLAMRAHNLSWPHNTERLSEQGALALTEQRAVHLEHAKELGTRAHVLSEQARAVEREWYKLRGERDAQVGRSRMLYGLTDLFNHNLWPRAAHSFGENWARVASHTLFGTFDTRMGPARWQVGAI